MTNISRTGGKKSRRKTDYLKLGLTGFCMGIADVIPGVSGGTIAFMFGIYEELISSVRAFDLDFLRLLSQWRFRTAFEKVNGAFLFCVLGGIAGAIIVFARVVSWLLSDYPVLVHAFFFGLILGTVPVIAKNIKKWTPPMFVSLAISTAGMYFIVGMVPLNTPETYFFLFICGVIAICAMILPGISGAFLLFILGKYQYVIDAVTHLQVGILLVFGSGCVVGILSFVRLLHWLFNRFHDSTVVILTGLVIGSLRKIWPWKETLQSIKTSHGKIIPIEQINFFPDSLNLEVILAVCLIITGYIIAVLIGRQSPDSILKKD